MSLARVCHTPPLSLPPLLPTAHNTPDVSQLCPGRATLPRCSELWPSHNRFSLPEPGEWPGLSSRHCITPHITERGLSSRKHIHFGKLARAHLVEFAPFLDNEAVTVITVICKRVYGPKLLVRCFECFLRLSSQKKKMISCQK